MAAKHIQIAEAEGVQAGFDSYMGTPVSKRQDAYQAISKKRTPATQLDAYCKAFGLVNDENGVIQDATATDIQAIVEAAVREAMGMSAPETAPTKAKTTRKKAAKTITATITNDEAWKALGADPAFKSKNRGDEPATNGQLYRLNTAGLLTLTS